LQSEAPLQPRSPNCRRAIDADPEKAIVFQTVRRAIKAKMSLNIRQPTIARAAMAGFGAQ
jgi:hypothetical protein